MGVEGVNANLTALTYSTLCTGLERSPEYTLKIELMNTKEEWDYISVKWRSMQTSTHLSIVPWESRSTWKLTRVCSYASTLPLWFESQI